MSLFKRGGFDAVNEEKERQEKNRLNMQKGLWRFFIKNDGDEADILFLTEEPINFYEHTIKRGGNQYDSIPCTGSDCPHCADGDRPSFKSAWLIVDRREYEYKDKDGKKKKGKDQIRLLVYGTRVASQLDRLHTKYKLVGREYTIVRTGTGTQTSYMFERGDKIRLSPEEIEQLLPEALREEYDGTMESLYTLIENQILMQLDEDTNEEDDDLDDGEDDLINVDEEDEEIEDDIEIDEEPKKKKGLFKSSTKKKTKKPLKKSKKIENKVKGSTSVKSILKNRKRK